MSLIEKTVLLNNEIPLNVTFAYDPEEKGTREYPGYDAEVEISKITFKGYETNLNHYFNDAVIEELEKSCLELMEG